MKNFQSSLIVLMGLGVILPTAGAYELQGEAWSVESMPVSWVLTDNFTDDGITNDNVVEPLQRAMSHWTDPRCSYATASYSGRTQTYAWSFIDGENIMMWINDPAIWPADQTSFALTSTSSEDGVIIDRDIIFNGSNPDYLWTATGEGGNVDLESIATHEMGHFWGIGHSQVEESTMFPSYNGGDYPSSLEQDDILALCAVYPKYSGVGEDCGEIDLLCEDGLVCYTGRELGLCAEPCVTGADCNPGEACLGGGQKGCVPADLDEWLIPDGGEGSLEFDDDDIHRSSYEGGCGCRFGTDPLI